MCSSELVLLAMSAAIRAASSACLEPSVASRILVGKTLISDRLLSRLMTKVSDNEVRCISRGAMPRHKVMGSLYSPSCPEGLFSETCIENLASLFTSRTENRRVGVPPRPKQTLDVVRLDK